MSPPPTMRRVVVSAGSIDVVTAPTPRPAPHEALVMTTLAGICGSDTHAAQGRHPFISLPYHPGHEVVGLVAETGADVTSVRPGQRVTVEPTLPCWQCKMCRTERPNLCERLQFFGCGWQQGGMANYFTVPANRLHAIPDELDDVTAALIEPMSTPVHAVRTAGDVAGKAIAVIGAGTIGLLLVAVLRARNARRIVVTDMLPSKRNRALTLGADAVVDAASANVEQQIRTALAESADVVFDCVAVEPTVRTSVRLASKGGTVVIVGVPSRDVTVPLPIIQDHQIRIQGSATYLARDYDESINLLRDGKIRTADIVTATRPLDAVAEAFHLSSSGEEVKVLLTIGDGGTPS
jgi:2-desacetyl-2-hydroxyethyl bacteriochlorophyllide A dehydrogenase